jgi:hypothetical protein
MNAQLVEIISAFGAACRSDNALLIKLASEHANQFLASVDVVARPELAEEETPPNPEAA